MQHVMMTALEGEPIAIRNEDVATLKAKLGGRLVEPDNPDYDQVRSIWNAMINRRPKVIVQCASETDVISAMNFARENRILTSVRGSGHNIAGNSVCDGGLMIDLSLMKQVEVDPKNKMVHVQPGVTLGELDTATQAHGLAIPVGINSTTGIAGLTLGGGFGWLSRKHGLTVDSLRSVTMVTTGGEKLTANADENADLFWGLRGGGGNFGIVTSFVFEAYPLGPDVLSGMIVHPLSDGKTMLEHYRSFAASAPDELSVWVVSRSAPPLPFLPEEFHGTSILAFAFLYTGDIEEGKRALEPLRKLGKPIGEAVIPHKFTDWQQVFDPLLTPGARNYWKSHNFTELSDAMLDTLLDFAARLPSAQTEIFIAQLGGAQSRVAAGSTAYPHRKANFVMNVHGRWNDTSEDEKCKKWAREFFDAAAPHATGGVYVNFMPDDEQARIGSAYGDHYDRLETLKKKYDPDNMLRMNQNIRPKDASPS